MSGVNLRRHPPGRQLSAWFDGEDVTDEVGGHVARCPRCSRSVSEMARVRAWMKAQPFFTPGSDEASSPATLRTRAVVRRRRSRALAMALVVVLALLVANAPRLRGPERSVGADHDGPSALFDSGTEGQPRPPVTGEQGDREPKGPSPSNTGAGLGRGPLRLGLVVPTQGTAAAEGADVVRAVRQRVDAANAAGGMRGLPIELVVAAAEDPGAMATLPKRASVLVGGFGALPPPNVSWLFPADPSITGPNVVAAQPSPEVAGQQIGDLLRGQPLGGPVGVVVGAGPESALAAGLGSKVPTTTVAAASDGTCTAQVASLRRGGAVALAVAAPPDVARQCLTAATRGLWSPRFGTVVAPSAAYAGLDAVTEARGSRTVLGLPWLTSPSGGGARVRNTTGARSYRALVSFAATELAIDAASQKGTLSTAGLASGTWRSDLFELAGTTIRPIPVVMGTNGWLSAPELGLAPILPPLLPPLLPVPVPGLSS